ncbi:hypothetical protein F2P81_012395 [Scophthalmus maximus]|uniref:Uncharacterized protein n=1 Tax=Scophthalmus maximus TaxID=52904 RepID=A0A6A4SN66_SCOMX|nr:hypothetical protein F2P81_012395 [Scophthalmus maximus]
MSGKFDHFIRRVQTLNIRGLETFIESFLSNTGYELVLQLDGEQANEDMDAWTERYFCIRVNKNLPSSDPDSNVTAMRHNSVSPASTRRQEPR